MDSFDNSDPVETLEFLLHRWDAAHASYRAAQEAYGALRGLPGPAEERADAEAKALAELTEIKLRIDRLIAESGRRRSPVKDSIVIASLQRQSSDSVRKLDEADSERMVIKESKFRKR
jgi:hypothetical protein